ncbi:BN159_2729 family protein [Streptomyces sp. H49]|uniref:BN159_2729 family protein n=1 Tax=Streptomyces sp. H49 TaxID=3444117 RepID=UPI003F4AE33D
MNRNLPHAISIIRAAIAAASDGDLGTAIANALNDEHLLVDAEQSADATVSSRAPEAEPLTDLERQALAWDASCKRASAVAAGIEQLIGRHPEFQSLRTDGDRILVALHITDQAQWAAWRSFFGITHDKERPLPYAVAGDGYRDGVRVSVVAYDLPQVRATATDRAQEPFELDGLVYDLARPQRDAQGDVWYSRGRRAGDGMPLLSMEGRPERCSLANIVQQVGPLTPASNSSASSTPLAGESGGRA